MNYTSAGSLQNRYTNMPVFHTGHVQRAIQHANQNTSTLQARNQVGHTYWNNARKAFLNSNKLKKLSAQLILDLKCIGPGQYMAIRMTGDSKFKNEQLVREIAGSIPYQLRSSKIPTYQEIGSFLTICVVFAQCEDTKTPLTTTVPCPVDRVTIAAADDTADKGKYVAKEANEADDDRIKNFLKTDFSGWDDSDDENKDDM